MPANATKSSAPATTTRTIPFTLSDGHVASLTEPQLEALRVDAPLSKPGDADYDDRMELDSADDLSDHYSALADDGLPSPLSIFHITTDAPGARTRHGSQRAAADFNIDDGFPNNIHTAIRIGNSILANTPRTSLPSRILVGDNLRDEIADQLHQVSAAGMTHNNPLRHAPRAVSPPSHPSHLPRTTPSPFPARPTQSEAAASPSATTHTRAVVNGDTRVEHGPRPLPSPPISVSPTAPLPHADRSSATRTTAPEASHAEPPFTPILHHPPDAQYHAIYDVVGPPLPAFQHVQLRNIMVTTYEHVTLHAQTHSFDQWTAALHDKLHREPTPFNRQFHAQLFIPTSEWAGNPFLYALEESTLRQAYQFFQATSHVLKLDVKSMLRLINELLAFRLDGPDAAIVVQQRLMGYYGQVGEPTPRCYDREPDVGTQVRPHD